MGLSEAWRFIQTGIVPSLTGGFFVNSDANEDLVLAQFYFLLALWAIPLALVLGWEDEISTVAKISYSIIVGIVMLLIQLLNTTLHRVLDLDGKMVNSEQNLAKKSNTSGSPSDHDGTSNPDSQEPNLRTAASPQTNHPSPAWVEDMTARNDASSTGAATGCSTSMENATWSDDECIHQNSTAFIAPELEIHQSLRSTTIERMQQDAAPAHGRCVTPISVGSSSSGWSVATELQEEIYGAVGDGDGRVSPYSSVRHTLPRIPLSMPETSALMQHRRARQRSSRHASMGERAMAEAHSSAHLGVSGGSARSTLGPPEWQPMRRFPPTDLSDTEGCPQIRGVRRRNGSVPGLSTFPLPPLAMYHHSRPRTALRLPHIRTPHSGTSSSPGAAEHAAARVIQHAWRKHYRRTRTQSPPTLPAPALDDTTEEEIHAYPPALGPSLPPRVYGDFGAIMAADHGASSDSATPSLPPTEAAIDAKAEADDPSQSSDINSNCASPPRSDDLRRTVWNDDDGQAGTDAPGHAQPHVEIQHGTEPAGRHVYTNVKGRRERRRASGSPVYGNLPSQNDYANAGDIVIYETVERPAAEALYSVASTPPNAYQRIPQRENAYEVVEQHRPHYTDLPLPDIPATTRRRSSRRGSRRNRQNRRKPVADKQLPFPEGYRKFLPRDVRAHLVRAAQGTNAATTQWTGHSDRFSCSFECPLPNGVGELPAATEGSLSDGAALDKEVGDDGSGLQSHADLVKGDDMLGVEEKLIDSTSLPEDGASAVFVAGVDTALGVPKATNAITIDGIDADIVVDTNDIGGVDADAAIVADVVDVVDTNIDGDVDTSAVDSTRTIDAVVADTAEAVGTDAIDDAEAASVKAVDVDTADDVYASTAEVVDANASCEVSKTCDPADTEEPCVSFQALHTNATDILARTPAQDSQRDVKTPSVVHPDTPLLEKTCTDGGGDYDDNADTPSLQSVGTGEDEVHDSLEDRSADRGTAHASGDTVDWNSICIRTSLVALDNLLDVTVAMKRSLEECSPDEAQVLGTRQHRIEAALQDLQAGKLVDMEALYADGTLVPDPDDDDGVHPVSGADPDAADDALYGGSISSGSSLSRPYEAVQDVLARGSEATPTAIGSETPYEEIGSKGSSARATPTSGAAPTGEALQAQLQRLGEDPHGEAVATGASSAARDGRDGHPGEGVGDDPVYANLATLQRHTARRGADGVLRWTRVRDEPSGVVADRSIEARDERSAEQAAAGVDLEHLHRRPTVRLRYGPRQSLPMRYLDLYAASAADAQVSDTAAGLEDGSAFHENFRSRSSTIASRLADVSQSRVGLHRSTAHVHPLFDASTDSTPWLCDLCRRHNREANLDERYRCNEGCDFDLCDHCMTETATFGVCRGAFHRRDRRISRARGPATGVPGQPLAASHEDTRPGSVHYFLDENNERVYYTFGRGASGGGILADVPRRRELASAADPMEDPYGTLSSLFSSSHPHLADLLRTVDIPSRRAFKPLAPEHTFTFLGRRLKWRFDRPTLLAAFDRNQAPASQVPLAVLLAGGSAYVGFELSNRTTTALTCLVWFTCATAQYALVKTVQPDPGMSLVNERNSGFMRAVYFIFFGVIAVRLHDTQYDSIGSSATVHGVDVAEWLSSTVARDLAFGIVLCLPLIWLFGHLPMWWRTLVHHVVEQADVHVLGGGGSRSLAAALTRLAINVVGAALCYTVAFVALETKTDQSEDNMGGIAVFHGVCVFVTYFIARLPADPRACMNALRSWRGVAPACKNEFASQPWYVADNVATAADVLGHRLAWDPLKAMGLGVGFALLHITGVTHKGTPTLLWVCAGCAVVIGCVMHFLRLELSRQYPFKVLKFPMLEGSVLNREGERAKCTAVITFVEANILYPLIVGCSVVLDTSRVLDTFGRPWGAGLLTVASIKVLRMGFSERKHLWLSLLLALLVHHWDAADTSQGLLLDLFLLTFAVRKGVELVHKLGFAYTYSAPWNNRDVFGSGFHVVMYPLQVPHAAMLLVQAVVATFFSAPLYPVAGSSLFLVSYLRPIKYFERRFTTTRVRSDGDFTRMQYTVGATANNLNSIFYIQLHRQLRNRLARDLDNGILGEVTSGDIFVFTNLSNSMSFFLHIIDRGSGYVSFQIRGLEFAGTFCQAREIEALDVDDETETGDTRIFSSWSWCASTSGPLRNVLPLKTALQLRWRTWEREARDYPAKGYSISLLTAKNLFPTNAHRSLLRQFITQSMVFYATRHPKFHDWLQHPSVLPALERTKSQTKFVEKGSHLLFIGTPLDLDYDRVSQGVTLTSFLSECPGWVHYCIDKHCAEDFYSSSRAFVFLVSILLRRLLGACMFHSKYRVVHITRRAERFDDSLDEYFRGFHRLFEGRVDYAVAQCEWAADLEDFTRDVVVKSARTALQLFQDNFADYGCYDDDEELYESLETYGEGGAGAPIVCPETDEQWEQGIMTGASQLLSFRHNIEDSSNNDMYYIVTLTWMKQWYKIFRVNPESVRGLWASQQQELLYFRNGDAERGSIQNAKCVLRNLVSQSCDQPVGYPIFISEIDHSYNSAVPSASAMGGDSVGPLGTLSRWVRRLGGHTLRAFAKKAASNTNDAAVRINVEGEVENARAISTDVEMDTLAAPQDEADVVDTRSLSPESAFAYASRRSILEPEDGSAGNPSHVRDAATLSRGDNGSRDNGMAAETSFTAAVGLQEDGTLSI
eukprot:m.70421 g.70421  ORF g.70421 m.70421 type:complete len:2703 (-) comp16051_c0_seq12:2557-10665(-)